MRKKNFKGRCEKRILSKCERLFKSYDPIQNAYADKKLPPMLAGKRLEDALTILPDYDPEIVYENEAVRLMALSDMYRIFVPTQMAKEIYTRR